MFQLFDPESHVDIHQNVRGFKPSHVPGYPGSFDTSLAPCTGYTVQELSGLVFDDRVSSHLHSAQELFSPCSALINEAGSLLFLFSMIGVTDADKWSLVATTTPTATAPTITPPTTLTTSPTTTTPTAPTTTAPTSSSPPDHHRYRPHTAVSHAKVSHAMVSQAKVSHAKVSQAMVSHAKVSQAMVSHANRLLGRLTFTVHLMRLMHLRRAARLHQPHLHFDTDSEEHDPEAIEDSDAYLAHLHECIAYAEGCDEGFCESRETMRQMARLTFRVDHCDGYTEQPGYNLF